VSESYWVIYFGGESILYPISIHAVTVEEKDCAKSDSNFSLVFSVEGWRIISHFKFRGHKSEKELVRGYLFSLQSIV
jgi:hypothetical protein